MHLKMSSNNGTEITYIETPGDLPVYVFCIVGLVLLSVVGNCLVGFCLLGRSVTTPSPKTDDR